MSSRAALLSQVGQLLFSLSQDDDGDDDEVDVQDAECIIIV